MTGTSAENQAEPAELPTVWVCIHDGAEYEPGPARVCPTCGSPDHRGKAVKAKPEPQPEDEAEQQVAVAAPRRPSKKRQAG
jgi:hypothetical protein